jgi:hypothetical protein
MGPPLTFRWTYSVLMVFFVLPFIVDCFEAGFSRFQHGKLMMASTREYDAIADTKVYRTNNGDRVRVGQLWKDEDRTLLVLFRSYG